MNTSAILIHSFFGAIHFFPLHKQIFWKLSINLVFWVVAQRPSWNKEELNSCFKIFVIELIHYLGNCRWLILFNSMKVPYRHSSLPLCFLSSIPNIRVNAAIVWCIRTRFIQQVSCYSFGSGCNFGKRSPAQHRIGGWIFLGVSLSSEKGVYSRPTPTDWDINFV